MINTSPITNLNNSAKLMVQSTINNTDSKEHIKNFLQTANRNNLHGVALVSFYTELNKINNVRKCMTSEQSKRDNKIPLLLENKIELNKDLKTEADIFIYSTKQKYTKTLDKRIALLEESAVIAEKILPKSKMKHIYAFLNLFARDEI